MKQTHYLTATLLLAFLHIFTPSMCSAQVPTIQWQKTYGGTLNDGARRIVSTFNGGYVVAGYAVSNTGDVTGNHGDGDCWVVNIDSSGNILWEHSYGGTMLEDAKDIKQTADSGFLIAGYTMSNDGDITGYHGNIDMWVLKIDAAGAIVWQKTLGGSDDEQANAICPTSDGGSIVTGWTGSTDGDVTSYHGAVWVVKLDAAGNIQWDKTFGGSSNSEMGNDILQTTDGKYVLAGFTRSSDGDVTFNHGFLDAWVLKLDDTGGMVWQKTYGGGDADGANAIKQTVDGGYIFAASTKSNNGQVTGYHGGTLNGLGDYWVVKIDDTGSLQWQKTYGGSSDEVPNAIVPTHDSGYILVGSTNSQNGDITYKRDTTDIWVVKISKTGALEWEKTLGGPNVEIGQHVLQCADHTYMVAGYTKSGSGDVTDNQGGQDYWVVKLGPSTAVGPLLAANDMIKVYPSLITNKTVYVELPAGYEHAQFSLTNMQGQSIPVNEGAGLKRTIVFAPAVAAGTYVLRIESQGKCNFYKLFITN